MHEVKAKNGNSVEKFWYDLCLYLYFSAFFKFKLL